MATLINQSSSFCSCTPSAQVVTPQTTPCDDCVTAATIVTDCDNSTPPGGASGSINLAQYNNYGGCASGGSPCTVTYTVLEYDTIALTNVGIDGNGLLTWDTTANAIADTFPEVHYIVQCDCNKLSARAAVKICIRDLCDGVICSGSESCNEATGLCEPNTPDVELT